MTEEAVRELSFEAAVERLEGIVTAMETGNLPLDECLRQFEEAVQLSRRCAAQLDQAEQRIQVLNADGQLQVSPTPPWES